VVVAGVGEDGWFRGRPGAAADCRLEEGGAARRRGSGVGRGWWKEAAWLAAGGGD
jgi:hypothetical protein